ncbi:uncharacterized protein LOC111628078 [Centruroides sculpturatus]|uniref:uncharacterized protein LOC111628078 n=1 Tax=Centruroides sculpturatus TaxID=218467 RepID=UPI000C6DE3A1|nr:uncharacterized protein LOC111628078 [Centruroides sculpturatus]
MILPLFYSFTATSCISEVIPQVVTLLKYLGKEETADRTPNFLRMRLSLQVELETQFNFDEDDKYLVATFLDLHFKTSFLGLVQMQRAKQKILLEALKISCDESPSTDDDSSPLHKKININENDKTIEIHNSFWNCFEEGTTKNMQNDEDVEKKSVIANEIDFYMKTVCLDWTTDLYKWWSANTKQYPSLTEFAKIYLSSPGSSIVYSERLFSEAG